MHKNEIEKLNKEIIEKEILINSLKKENEKLNNIIINDKEKISLKT
jgi:hypothetical protein